MNKYFYSNAEAISAKMSSKYSIHIRQSRDFRFILFVYQITTEVNIR